MLRNLAKPLLAVIIGNLIYFLLMPVLPSFARHGIARLDWGLVVDFSVCLVTFGIITLISHRGRAEK